MENPHLYSYLLENGHINQRYANALKSEIDQRVYSFGDHFKSHSEQHDAAKKFKRKNHLKAGYLLYKNLFTKKTRHKDPSRKNIISTAYFGLESKLEKIGYAPYSAPWKISMSKDNLTGISLFRFIARFQEELYFNNVQQLLRQDFFDLCASMEEKLKDYFLSNKIEAFFASNDIAFFENLSISIFKDLKRPSFIFLHGLPARYNNIDDNRADYLIVWGQKIKEHYMSVGVPGEKIFVSGHPLYNINKLPALRSGIEKITVLTKAVNGGQHSDKVRLSDRGNLITYLCSIRNVLRKVGVNSVKFRPHPSENPEWYYRFIDRSFFELDTDGLETSLKNSSLIIGPTSSVFLEALYYGVNYLVYEPVYNDLDLINFPLVPPFDGSDKHVPVAFNEEQLEDLLKRKVKANSAVFHEYIQPEFSLDFVNQLIK